MICGLNEAKVVLQCGNKSLQSLGIGGGSVEDPDGDCTLQASSLHFIDGELHLVSDLWVTSSLHVLAVVLHSELHSAVFICNQSFLTFLLLVFVGTGIFGGGCHNF